MKITDTLGRRIDLAESFLEPGLFGDGSDGSPVLNGGGSPNSYPFADYGNDVYTLNRSIFCVNLTVNSGVTLRTNGFRVFCSGTLLNAGHIAADGGEGGSVANPTGASGGATLLGEEVGGGSAGGNGGDGGTGTGGDGAAGSDTVYSMGGDGGMGGNGGGGSGYQGASASSGGQTTYRPFRTLSPHLLLGTNLVAGGAGGGGGGGGGGDALNYGAGGGYGGGGGGVVLIFAARIINTDGLISAKGAAGGTGGDGQTGAVGGGGGGGGAGGGVVYLAYDQFEGATATVSVDGGTGGAGGAKAGAGDTGSDGSNGEPGTILRYNSRLKRWEA